MGGDLALSLKQAEICRDYVWIFADESIDMTFQGLHQNCLSKDWSLPKTVLCICMKLELTLAISVVVEGGSVPHVAAAATW